MGSWQIIETAKIQDYGSCLIFYEKRSGLSKNFSIKPENRKDTNFCIQELGEEPNSHLQSYNQHTCGDIIKV